MDNTERNCRWHMNKLGLVNFWLYDKEEFSLIDGKIMLRGQNGSGKSITTQSFIPFILDGDRSPERLDPFGSRDRKMDYYFLEDTDADDVTGYVYLEFVRINENSQREFRTIGIGQRAQRGKGMTGFWGFIILDGRRIGEDIELTKEAGSSSIPMSCKELEYALGTGNILMKSQKEYKENVNKYLFGFSNIELYDQFIALLVKVRAPKLSKEFKPSRVYEILNESLQTLTDDDLSSMVDAMEKLDDMELRLNDLKRTASDLKDIGSEYSRYNSYIFGKKAEKYLEAKKRTSAEQKKIAELNQAVETASKEYTEKEELKQNLETETEISKRELDVLGEDQLTNLVEKLKKLESENQYKNSESERKKDRLQSKKVELIKLDRIIKDTEDGIRAYENNAFTEFRELDDINNRINFKEHSNISGLFRNSEIVIPSDTLFFLKEVRNSFNEYRKLVSSALETVRLFEEEIAKMNEKEKEWDEEKQKLKGYKSELDEKINIEDATKDEILESYELANSGNQEFLVPDETLMQLKEMLFSYSGENDRIKISDLRENKRKYYEKKLDEESNRIESQINILREKKNKLIEELNVLKTTKDPIPARIKETEKSRKILEEKGIAAVPFYEAFEFDDRLSDREKARIELQVRMSGMLDALLIKEDNISIAEHLVDGGADSFLKIGKAVNEPCSIFTVSDKAVELGLMKEAETFLAAVSCREDGEAEIVLEIDGYFRNGVLSGYANPLEDSESEYIGAESRRKMLLKRINEKNAEIKKVEEEIDSQIEKQGTVVKRKNCLECEYEKIPNGNALQVAYVARIEAEEKCNKCEEECIKKERDFISSRDSKSRAEHTMLNTCRELPFEKNTKVYGDVLEEMEDYSNGFEDLKDSILELNKQNEILNDKKVSLDKAETDIEDIALELKDIETEMLKISKEAEQIRQVIDDPQNKEKAEKIKKLKERIAENSQKIEELKNRTIELNIQIKNDKEKAEALKSELEGFLVEEQTLQQYFEEEYEFIKSLSRSPDRGNDPDEKEYGSLQRLAESALNRIKESDRQKSAQDLVVSLMKTYQEHSSSVQIYGARMEPCFEDSIIDGAIRSRQKIIAKIQGREVSIYEFERHIRESIESNEQLIQQSDRELFEKILSNTLSTRLVDRIRASREWVSKMSELMQQMKTSMGLNFSLKWLPKETEEDGMLGTKELEKLLGKDTELLSAEDAERVAKHFRNAVKNEKEKAIREERTVNYPEMIRDILDYRKWFEFQMKFKRINEEPKELTDRQFNRFSGGEKAMAMYIPLFGALNAQYSKAELGIHPRLVALDEAFAGVDEINIDSMFELVEELDLDYIMNSQVLWGCYPSVKGLKISELYRPENSKVVSVISYTWNGKEKRLEG